MKSFLAGVVAVVGELGVAVTTGAPAGVAAPEIGTMLVAEAGKELTAACTAATIAAWCVSVLDVVVGCALTDWVVFSEASGAEELKLVRPCTSAALAPAAGRCNGETGVVDMDVAASVEVVSLATGSIAGAVSVTGSCEAGGAPEPAEDTGADSKGAFIPPGVPSDCGAVPDGVVPVLDCSTRPVSAAGATGTALDSAPETTVLVGVEDDTVGLAARALVELDACFAGSQPAFCTNGVVAGVRPASAGCTSCAITGWFAGGVVVVREVGTCVGVVRVGCFAALPLLAVFFSVDAADDPDDPAFERTPSMAATGNFKAGAFTSVESTDACARVSVKLEVGSHAGPCIRRDAPEEGRALLAA